MGGNTSIFSGSEMERSVVAACHPRHDAAMDKRRIALAQKQLGVALAGHNARQSRSASHRCVPSARQPAYAATTEGSKRNPSLAASSIIQQSGTNERPSSG